MITRLPIVKKNMELGSVGFYEFKRILNCPFGGLAEHKAIEYGKLPETLPNKQLIVGKVFHELMEQAVKVVDRNQLLVFAKSLTDKYQAEYLSYISSKKLGPISGWSEVGKALSSAIKSFSNRQRVSDKKIRNLLSKNNRFKGIPDKYYIDGDDAFLSEYKSSSLYMDGKIKNEYLEQVKYYAYLLKQNYTNLKTVNICIISLSEEKYDFIMTEGEIAKYEVEINNLYESLLGREFEQAFLLDNCMHCQKRPICIDFIENSHSCETGMHIFVVGGVVTDIEIGESASKLTVNNDTINININININNDNGNLSLLISGEEYTFYNLLKVKGEYFYSDNSGIYGKS